jgi:hypothetical protein
VAAVVHLHHHAHTATASLTSTSTSATAFNLVIGQDDFGGPGVAHANLGGGGC